MIANTVGSLTEGQKSVVLGTLLGDGYMRCKTNANLEINHSRKQKDYVDWLFGVFKNLVLTPPVSRLGNNGRRAYRFTTRSLPVLTVYYDLFYKDRKKIAPPGLKLDSVTLSVWFMDDGSSPKDVYLNTQQFSYEDQKRLIAILNRDLGIASTLNKDKHYFRIRIKKESIGKLREIIGPHLVSSMKYKLPL